MVGVHNAASGQSDDYLHPLSIIKLVSPLDEKEPADGAVQTPVEFTLPSADDSRSPLYAHLKPGEFRLIRYRGANLAGLPVYSLLFHEQKSSPPYYALSYCWGDYAARSRVEIEEGLGKEVITTVFPDTTPLSPTHVIVCNGHNVLVTENLFLALSELAKLQPVYLWVDQICINQEDLVERSAQVAVMGDIYSRAVRTLAWTGPLDGKDRVTRSTLQFPLMIRRFRSIWDKDDILAEISPGSGRYQQLRDLEPFGFPAEAAVEEWIAIADLLSRPWFARLWVVQEVLLSQDEPLLIYGDMCYEFYEFCRDVTWLRRELDGDAFGPEIRAMFIRRMDRTMTDIVGRFVDLADLRAIRKLRWDFRSALLATENMKVSNLKDAIFGILGFTAPETLPKNFAPDYTVQTEVLYQTVSRHMLQAYDDLDFLVRAAPIERHHRPLDASEYHLSQMTNHSKGSIEESADSNEQGSACNLRMPSWSSDLSGRWQQLGNSITGTETDVTRREDVIHVECRSGYHASHGLLPVMGPYLGPRVFSVKGIEVDAVRSLLPPFTSGCIVNWETSNIPRMWEMAMDVLGFEETMSDQEMQDLAAKFFEILVPFDEYSSPRALSDFDGAEGLRRLCWTFIHGTFEAQQGRKYSTETLARFARFAEGSIDPGVMPAESHRFFITEHKRLGFGPKGTQPGDVMFVLLGARHPVLLERCGEGYHYLGEAFVRDLMNGQAVDACAQGKLQHQWVNLH